MFEHVTHTPSFGPHNGEREAVLTSRSLAVSNHPPGAGPAYSCGGDSASQVSKILIWLEVSSGAGGGGIRLVPVPWM